MQLPSLPYAMVHRFLHIKVMLTNASNHMPGEGRRDENCVDIARSEALL